MAITHLLVPFVRLTPFICPPSPSCAIPARMGSFSLYGTSTFPDLRWIAQKKKLRPALSTNQKMWDEKGWRIVEHHPTPAVKLIPYHGFSLIKICPLFSRLSADVGQLVRQTVSLVLSLRDLSWMHGRPNSSAFWRTPWTTQRPSKKYREPMQVSCDLGFHSTCTGLEFNHRRRATIVTKVVVFHHDSFCCPIDQKHGTIIAFQPRPTVT